MAENVNIPSGMGGLVRYSEESESKIKLKPNHVIIMIILIIIFVLILNVFFPIPK